MRRGEDERMAPTHSLGMLRMICVCTEEGRSRAGWLAPCVPQRSSVHMLLFRVSLRGASALDTLLRELSGQCLSHSTRNLPDSDPLEATSAQS